jgi:hypothetical protein
VDLLLQYLCRQSQLLDEVEKALRGQLSSLAGSGTDPLGRHRYLIFRFREQFNAHFVYPMLFYRIFSSVLHNPPMILSHFEAPDLADSDAMNDARARFRKEVWELFETHFDSNKKESFMSFVNYLALCEERRYYIPEDMPYVIKIIDKFVEPDNFSHCYWVNRFLDLLQEAGFDKNQLNLWRQRFTNETFSLYQLLRGESRFGRRSVPLTHMEYEEMRVSNIQSGIQIGSSAEFKILYDRLLVIQAAKPDGPEVTCESLDVIVFLTYRQNLSLGWQVFTFIQQVGNSLGWIPQRLVKEIMKGSKIEIDKLYKMIKAAKHPLQQQWLFRFYYELPEAKVSRKHAADVLTLFQLATEVRSHLVFGLEKYSSTYAGFYPTLTRILVKRRKEDPAFGYDLPHDFFRGHQRHFQKASAIAAEAYLQLDNMDGSYDQEGDELFFLLKRRPAFLQELIQQKIEQNTPLRSSLKQFAGIWLLKNGKDIVLSAMVQIIDQEQKWDLKTFGQSFFFRLPAKTVGMAEDICRQLVDLYKSKPIRLNMVFEIVRHTLPAFYPSLVVYFVTINNDIDIFSQLQLLNSGFSSNSRTDIWADRRAQEWKALLDAIRILPDQYQYVEHVEYLLRRITGEERNAFQERKRQFMTEDWYLAS